MAENKAASKRINNACLPCQRRKTRCDGVTPVCANCTKQGITCSYAERRRRGPGKSKKHIEDLEERLRSLENVLQSKSSQHFTSSEPLVDPQLTDPGSLNHTSVLESHSRGSLEEVPNTASQASPLILATATSDIPSFHSSTQLPSENMGIPLETPVSDSLQNDTTLQINDLPASLKHLALLTKMPGKPSIIDLIHSQLNPSGFKRNTFIALNSQSYLIPLIQHGFDEISTFYPLYTAESFGALLQQQILAPADGGGSSVQWAITNALVAITIQWKVDNGAYHEIMPMAWGYFKNAFSILPELMIKGNDVDACQALLSMALFLRGTVDARATANLVSIAARAAHNIGLHKKAWYESLDPAVAERHKRVFWMTYIIECEEMMRQGLPSTFGPNEIDLEPPLNHPLDGLGDYLIPGTQLTINLFHFLSRLAMIQSQAFDELYFRRGPGLDLAQLQNAVSRFNHQLEVWRMDLPSEIRPNFHEGLTTPQPEMPIVYLILSFYTTIGIINSALDRSEPLHHAEGMQQNQSVIAARASVQLLNKMPPHPFVVTWPIMYHAMYAVITLFTSILENPLSEAAQANIQSIAYFIRCVEYLIVAYDCDLHKLLRGCKRMYQVAQLAIMSSPGHHPPHTQPPWLNMYLAKVDEFTSIPGRIPRGIDKMQMVQGLMGNIPVLCCKATDVFAKVLGVDPLWNQKYGLFAPDDLFPENFNFTFG